MLRPYETVLLTGCPPDQKHRRRLACLSELPKALRKRSGRGSAAVCRCSQTHQQGASEPRAGHEGLYDAINTAAGPVREDNEQGATI
jgi:hypothetical protein